jgi:hypothetical protein
MTLLRLLLADSIDYAGLFPPSRSTMAEAVTSYAKYWSGSYAELLGRFVIPSPRLDEFAGAAELYLPCDERPWRLSVLLGADWESDRESIVEFDAAHTSKSSRGHAVCDTIEARAAAVSEIRRIREMFSDRSAIFVEFPLVNADSLMPHVKAAGAKAKIRTGGVTADSFPEPGEIAAFIFACHRADVAFKATAGLHHPLRASYPLTYEAGSELAPMYGYLNLFLAAAAIHRGSELAVAIEALLESDPSTISVSDSILTWRDHRFAEAEIRQLRQFVLAFGSCSFVEPITEARQLGLLQ